MFRRLRSGSLAALATLLVAASAACPSRATLEAAPPTDSAGRAKATVVQLNVDPAAEPRPAFKYTLLVPASERKPGNAVPFYYRAILFYATSQAANQGAEMENKIQEWMSAPLATFPREAVRKALAGFRAFDELREATSREECNWDWRLEGVSGIKSFEFLLDEVQRSRGLARWLALKARLEIAEGRYDDAVDTLRMGYQLAHDLGKTQILITSLVGIAIGSGLDEQVHAFMGAPHSPNLYWALTELPRPLTESRLAVEFETGFPPRVFPFLKDPEHAEHSALQWADLVTDACGTLNRLTGENLQTQPVGWKDRLVATGYALQGYTRAKRDLIAAGDDAAQVEQMPVGQVIAIDEARICRYVSDEIRKWTLIPYPEGARRYQAAESALIQSGYMGPPHAGREILPVVSLLLPAIGSVGEAMSRRDTSIAADRVIEAIRMQAAQNGGKLPQSLADVTVVPAPDDPRTGKPFPYMVQGGTAILEVRRGSRAPEPMQPSDYIFEISIAHDRHANESRSGQ
jgi:hypothetical protein